MTFDLQIHFSWTILLYLFDKTSFPSISLYKTIASFIIVWKRFIWLFNFQKRANRFPAVFYIPNKKFILRNAADYMLITSGVHILGFFWFLFDGFNCSINEETCRIQGAQPNCCAQIIDNAFGRQTVLFCVLNKSKNERCV